MIFTRLGDLIHLLFCLLFNKEQTPWKLKLVASIKKAYFICRYTA